MKHSEIEEQFRSYLLAKGFPANTIIAEPIIGGRSRADIAIIDVKNSELLAAFEIKATSEGHTLRQAFNQLKEYANALKGLGIPIYLVIPARGPTFQEPFQFYKIRLDGEIEEVPNALFPTFEALAAGKGALKKDEIKREQLDTTDQFRRICSYIAILCLFLIVFDIYSANSDWKFEVLTTQRLTLLGAAISLFVIPYAQKIKALGFEYERAVERKKEANK